MDHSKYNQDYDDWYYKMYFYLLREIVRLGGHYAIYLDKKDTQGVKKVSLLRDILNRSLLDFAGETVRKIQIVESHEIELLQLTDLFIGAISYFNRELNTSIAKVEITNYLISVSKLLLTILHHVRQKNSTFLFGHPGGINFEKKELSKSACFN